MNPIHSMQDWQKMISGGKIALIGTGVSHRALSYQLLEQGADLTVLDQKENFGDTEDGKILLEKGAKLICGPSYLDHLSSFDLVLRSPGVKWHQPKLKEAREKHLPVTTEMEVFFALCPAPIYGVTGSDGKTTSTTLISEFFKAAGKKVFLGGNIGYPLLSRIHEITKDDVAVAELSSFQLMGMEESADRALITNLAPNHLDWHKSMEEYRDAKANLFLHKKDGITVLNEDNPGSMSYLPFVPGKVRSFSACHPVENGAYLGDDGMIHYASEGVSVPLFPKTSIRLRGHFNLENYLGALSMVYPMVPAAALEEVAKTFNGVAHRNETVRIRNGVEWINDSIATSPTRTNAGLTLYDRKIILIAGGYDKKIPYEPLAGPVLSGVRLLILMGDTAPAIEQAVRSHEAFASSGLEILHASSMEEAVSLADSRAKEGDIVKLSPASASFGLYRNFEERGEHFRRLVLSL